jgi:hypothetical protein
MYFIYLFIYVFNLFILFLQFIYSLYIVVSLILSCLYLLFSVVLVSRVAFQDHVRLRRQYGLKINEAMQHFFQRLGILDAQGEYTSHAGDPVWVYVQYCRARGDRRSEEAIRTEGELELRQVQLRGVHISRGYGEHVWQLNPILQAELDSLYLLSKQSLTANLSEDFVTSFGANAMLLTTCAESREEHVNFPKLGERLSEASVQALEMLAVQWTASLFSRYVFSSFLYFRFFYCVYFTYVFCHVFCL